MPKDVVIIFAGGHAKVIADIILFSGDNIVGFLDDDESKQGRIIYKDYKVIGKIEDCSKFKDCGFVIAVGDNKTRAKIAVELDVDWYTAIHPSAVIADTVKIGVGTVIMAGAIINVDTIIGEHCIINTAATVDHDNIIGDYVHVSPGAHLAGTVSVGKCSWIGIGSSVVNDIYIREGVIVGAGATVVKDLKSLGVYVGTPARKLSKA